MMWMKLAAQKSKQTSDTIPTRLFVKLIMLFTAHFVSKLVQVWNFPFSKTAVLEVVAFNVVGGKPTDMTAEWIIFDKLPL